MEKVERKIKQAAGNGFVAPCYVFFGQMKAAHATNQDRWIGFELIDFSGFVGIADSAIHRIAQVDLPLDHFTPVRRQRIFEVGHKDFYVGIHGVNHHFALDWAGDFDATIL
ncbi:hypothetical protein D3C72_978460 [compost metagenome]